MCARSLEIGARKSRGRGRRAQRWQRSGMRRCDPSPLPPTLTPLLRLFHYPLLVLLVPFGGGAWQGTKQGSEAPPLTKCSGEGGKRREEGEEEARHTSALLASWFCWLASWFMALVGVVAEAVLQAMPMRLKRKV